MDIKVSTKIYFKTLKEEMKHKRDYKKKAVSDQRYLSSEKGFVGIKYVNMTKPSALKKRPIEVKLNKEEYWCEYLNHREIMKERFPGSDGRLCRYCEKPFTFEVPLYERRSKNSNPAKRSPIMKTNLSVDRLDNTRCYERGNIIFCCAGCNNRKNQVTLEDCENILRVREDNEKEKFIYEGP